MKKNLADYLAEVDDPRFEWRDGKFVLKDGERFRVKMTDSAKPMSDGLFLAEHRNGWRLSAKAMKDDNVAARRALYDSYDKEISQAYLTPTGVGSTPSTELRGDQPGDVCTIDGWPGHLQKRGGKLVCIADDKTSQDARSVKKRKTQYRDPSGREAGTAEEAEEDLNDSRSIRDRAYQDYDKFITTQWRQPINEQTPPSNNPKRRPAGKVIHDTVASAYGDYDAELANAWRGK
jgi:hypothetical protein